MDKPYKLTDGEGMHLLVHPNGSKYWRLQYRFDGKQKMLALGMYPEISLSEARQHNANLKKRGVLDKLRKVQSRPANRFALMPSMQKAGEAKPILCRTC
jgi:hypothetical protein